MDVVFRAICSITFLPYIVLSWDPKDLFMFSLTRHLTSDASRFSFSIIPTTMRWQSCAPLCWFTTLHPNETQGNWENEIKYENGYRVWTVTMYVGVEMVDFSLLITKVALIQKYFRYPHGCMQPAEMYCQPRKEKAGRLLSAINDC